MKYSTILIITYGRSGSTLLQGILNSIDGCLIRGENYDFCYGLFHSFKCLLGTKKNKGDVPQDAWYGASNYRESVFIQHARGMMKALLLGQTADPEKIECLGFKEIRYMEKTPSEKDFQEYLTFLSLLFPNPAFIFNTRNLDDVIKSGWWADSEAEESLEKLKLRERNFSSYAANHANCFEISYDDVIAQSPKLEAMFEFLGAVYSSEKVKHILARPHSYNQRQEAVKELYADPSPGRERNR